MADPGPDVQRQLPLSDEQLPQMVCADPSESGNRVVRKGAVRAALARGAGALWLHIRRAISWNLQNLPVTAAEQARLAGLGIDEPVLQRYLTWRRSVLLVTCLPVALIALLTTLDRLDDGYPYVHGFGYFWLSLHILAPYALPAAAVAALLVWPRRRVSGRILAWGWLIAFLVPLVLFLVPAHWIFDVSRLWPEHQAFVQRGVDIVVGALYFVWLCLYLPVFLMSVALGIQRACLRLKSLLPEALIPGLFLIAAAPGIPLVLFPFIVLLTQVASNTVLILGSWLLLASPLVYAVFGRSLVRPSLTAADRTRLNVAQAISKGLFWLGMALLLVYATTYVWELPDFEGDLEDPHPLPHRMTILGFTSDGSLFRPWDWHIIRWLAVETLGRTLFTTVVVADLFLRLNRSVWFHHKQLAGDRQVDGYDRVMTVLDQPPAARKV